MKKCQPVERNSADSQQNLSRDETNGSVSNAKRARNKREHGISPQPLYFSANTAFLKIGGLIGHWRYSLKLFLPLLDELCGLFEKSYLIVLAVWCSAGQRMGGRGCQHPRFSRLWFTAVSDSPGALSVRNHTLVGPPCPCVQTQRFFGSRLP